MVQIVQGSGPFPDFSNVHIVIDVLRAFTVAHYAFMKGVRGIELAGTVHEAFRMKEMNPDFLLAGEAEGLPIEGFDLDNSPARLNSRDVEGRYLIQKTTNGVKAVLNALNADHVYVTGFSNAKTTALHIKHRLLKNDPRLTVKIIASHPSGDDDLACAQYMKSILLNVNGPTSEETAARIIASEAAQKFLDDTITEFDKDDIPYCIREQECGFVMKVVRVDNIPRIERVPI
ncbi:2-phosphosulfolactate phosphatase [Paenibacillus sp. DMB20]|uniref:2-phosphosulfolactate phosphatase n=1 Tax=Paenibacillus sp. DMB20 TaxID=1642570 RepID=UPI000A937315|nr:2-phosphosulfolactate phosphatase [Paenibacillus sp. DMB20]